MGSPRLSAAPKVPTSAPTPEQLDLGLRLPRRVDGAEAIPQLERDEEQLDVERADDAYIARLIDDAEVVQETELRKQRR